MSVELDKISQITIYLKDSLLAGRGNEVALINPLARPLGERKWTHHGESTPSSRFFIRCRSFVLKHMKGLMPRSRKTAEAKFKTAIALLLADENLRRFFLGSEERKKSFLSASLQGAQTIGYSFTPPEYDLSNDLIINELTTLSGSRKSLVEDPHALRLQQAALGKEGNEILFAILNGVLRPPVTQVIEIDTKGHRLEIELVTQHAKFQVFGVDSKTGRIDFTCERDQATPGIATLSNISPGAKGVMNQKRVLDHPSGSCIGTYCGQILSSTHLLEQLLFHLQDEKIIAASLHEENEWRVIEEKTFLFTSLFSWNEYEKILSEHEAIDALHGKVLHVTEKNGEKRAIKLHLLHHNLPFNLWNKFPTPAETKGQLQDLNDEMIIQILPRAWERLQLPFSPLLQKLASQISSSRQEKDFLKKQRGVLGAIDQFRREKKGILQQITESEDELAVALIGLLEGKKGIDGLLLTGVIATRLGLTPNTNSLHGYDRVSCACSADKAQRAFSRICGKPFLPGHSSQEEESLFRVFYTMVHEADEEPEVHMHENRMVPKRNPETTRYLTSWI